VSTFRADLSRAYTDHEMHLSFRARRFLVFLSIAMILFAALAPASSSHTLVSILSLALIFFAILIVAAQPRLNGLVFATQTLAFPVFAPRPPPAR
jgi:hypothetical protein